MADGHRVASAVHGARVRQCRHSYRATSVWSGGSRSLAGSSGDRGGTTLPAVRRTGRCLLRGPGRGGALPLATLRAAGTVRRGGGRGRRNRSEGPEIDSNFSFLLFGGAGLSY